MFNLRRLFLLMVSFALFGKIYCMKKSVSTRGKNDDFYSRCMNLLDQSTESFKFFDDMTSKVSKEANLNIELLESGKASQVTCAFPPFFIDKVYLDAEELKKDFSDFYEYSENFFKEREATLKHMKSIIEEMDKYKDEAKAALDNIENSEGYLNSIEKE